MLTQPLEQIDAQPIGRARERSLAQIVEVIGQQLGERGEVGRLGGDDELARDLAAQA